MVIAVEGMDGAGKTTICSHIERTFNFINIDKPTKYLFEDENGIIDYEKFKKTLEKVYRLSSKERAKFFGEGNKIAVNRYKGLDIVLDRHLVSNYYWNGDKSQRKYFKKLVSECGLPDLTIFLYASPKIRYERLKKRNSKDIDLYDESVFEEGTKKHLEFILQYNLPFVFIDTNDKSISEVCREVDIELKSLIFKSKKEVKKFEYKL